MFSFKYISSDFNILGNIFSIHNIKMLLEINGKATELVIVDSPGAGYEVLVPGYDIKAILNTGVFRDMLTIDIEFINTGKTSLIIGKCYFIKDSVIEYMDKPENTVIILQRGECAGNKNKRLLDIEDKDQSIIYTTVSSKGNGGVSLGFLSFDRAACKIDFSKNKNTTKTSLSINENSIASEYSMSVYCDFNKFEMKSEQILKTETFYVQEDKKPYNLLVSFADAVSYRYKIKTPKKTPVGWIGGWNFRDAFTKENHEKLVMQNVEAISKRLKDFGVEYIWISTVNTKDNLPGNWDLDNKYSFPNGMAFLSKYCRDRGMKTGLWIAPFWMNVASDNYHYVENAIAMKNGEMVGAENGRITHQPFNGQRPENLPRVLYLDSSHPDLHKFLKKTFTYYNEIGISYYMLDFLYHGIDPEYDLYDKDMINGPEAYRSTMQVIKKTVTEDTYLLSSSGPTYYNIGLVDGVRAARDFGEGRPVTKYCGFYPANYLTNNFNLVAEVTRDYAITHPNNKKLYINDAFNMVTIGKPVSKNEARVVCSLFGLSGNPVMMGDDIPSICEERLDMIKKILPITDNAMIPCDLFESCYPDTPSIYRYDVKKYYDEYTVMAIFNFENKPVTKSLNTHDIMGDNSEYIVYDFWNEHCLGTACETVDVDVPAHDVRVLRFTKTRSHPWVIGTDMHLTQGDVEMKHLRWDPDEMTLKGVFNRPAGETGRVFIHIPKGLEPVDFRELFIIREETQDINPDGGKFIVGMKKLEFDVETMDFNIAFREIKE